MKTPFHFDKLLQVTIKFFFAFLFIFSVSSFKANASNYYWIGGSGNWDDLNHWATTSGGSILYTQIPTALDDVYFDAHSFSAPGQLVNLNPLTILVHSMNWSGVTNNSRNNH